MAKKIIAMSAVLVLFLSTLGFAAETPSYNNRIGVSVWDLGTSQTDDIAKGYYLRLTVQYLFLRDFKVGLSYAMDPFGGDFKQGLVSGLRLPYVGVAYSPFASWTSIFTSSLSPMVSFLKVGVFYGLSTNQFLVNVSLLDFDLFL